MTNLGTGREADEGILFLIPIFLSMLMPVTQSNISENFSSHISSEFASQFHHFIRHLLVTKNSEDFTRMTVVVKDIRDSGYI
jgi:hypothetical protein